MDNTDLIYLRLRYISEYVLDILDEQIIRLILFCGSTCHVRASGSGKTEVAQRERIVYNMHGRLTMLFSMRQRIWF